jgi:hypothetical protein
MIGVAVVVGHGQPPATVLRQLHLLDCAPPCWIGIVPGQTPADEALRYFREAFALADTDTSTSPGTLFSSSFILPAIINTSGSMIASFEFEDGVANQMILQIVAQSGTLSDDIPDIGTMINLLGIPSCIRPPSLAIPRWWLIYLTENGAVEVGVHGEDFVSWTEPISFLMMRQRGDKSCPDDYYSWRGFHIQRYMS